MVSNKWCCQTVRNIEKTMLLCFLVLNKDHDVVFFDWPCLLTTSSTALRMLKLNTDKGHHITNFAMAMAHWRCHTMHTG